MQFTAIIFALLLLLVPAAASALDTGFELPDEYAKRVKDGIEKHRKSDATIRIVDSAGRPVEGARISARQVSHDFLFGCAFPSWNVALQQPNPDDWAQFEKHFLHLFNYVTTENMLKWHQVEREDGNPNYTMIDNFVDWCLENNITIKGHCLVWGIERMGLPQWLHDYPPDEIANRMRRHIHEVVDRYKGRIDIWDVVNEPLHCHWFAENMHPDYTVDALKWAREANPDAMLIVNEYGNHFGDTARRFVDFNQDLMDKGAPLDAIGEQAHDVPRIPSPQQLFGSLDTLTELGLDIHITEITFPSDGREVQSDFVSGHWTPELHGRYFRYYYTLAFSHPNVKAITIWAMWDGSSWLPEGGIIDRDWNPKPAYTELEKLIHHEWVTNVEGRTYAEGTHTFRGFHGKYDVSVRVGEQTINATLDLLPGQQNILTVQLP